MYILITNSVQFVMWDDMAFYKKKIYLMGISKKIPGSLKIFRGSGERMVPYSCVIVGCFIFDRFVVGSIVVLVKCAARFLMV